ncbi:hypothetical protein [Microbulbifer hainanensis]|uniref:hypothetical protein n=1 Tax=Microbulbifer hainanensis TaxID=2735675 RepID=UPI001866D731|nr:hypothetical protein [Microbulbifer hainanensis]
MTNSISQNLRRARRQWIIGGLLHHGGLALAAVAAFVAFTALGPLPTWLAPAFGVIVVTALVLDGHWRPRAQTLCRLLDGRYPQLQDSSQLLLSAPESLKPIERLQRQRTVAALGALLDSGALRSFRPRWHRSPLVNAAGACLGLLLFTLWPQLPDKSATAAPTAVSGNPAAALAVAAAVTQIAPPAYTGLPPRTQALQVSAPEGSSITWQVDLNAPVDGLTMLAAESEFGFRTDEALPSRRWSLTRRVNATDFYQLSARRGSDDVLLPEMHNIDIAADRAPEFAFRAPRDNVTVVNVDRDHQAALLQVSVDVSDDFAVAGTDLLITVASGSGENVQFRNDRIALTPEKRGSERLRHYQFAIPVHRYRIEAGDELYWFLQARDNQAPQANVSKSQHFIVRWPQEEIFGLSDAEGIAVKVLPEYFRSQRQLIIDTEALLAEREQISDSEFRKRSQSLAYEQNLLRMRYGRFLGEEDSAMEHHDTDEDHGATGGDHHDGPADHQQHEFGDATGVVAAAGHQHDSAENATLFDPQTKELLRSALNAMWSAHRDLSIVEPRASLPSQHTALRYIKQVQQATRIYLQRVGFEPPPLDERRRLSGEHDALTPPRVSAARAPGERGVLLELLARLRGGANPSAEDAMALRGLSLVREQSQLQVQLSKALRLVKQRPDCADCRRELTALLYQLTPAPAAQPSLPSERAAGGRFVDWLTAQRDAADDNPDNSGVQK